MTDAPAAPQELKAIMGLEVHAQLRTNAKMFCGCDTDYQKAGAPNANVCPTCTAQPGSKPHALNERCLEQAIKIALALGCKKIGGETGRITMQRKHYFYPDLPSNYQRTSTPLGENGTLCGVSIREVHIEEDPGRYDLKTGVVDYNRAGVPLIEIVTDPEITSPDHARKFLDELRAILDYLDAARSDDSGSIRADANISIVGHERVEVKNINSTRGVFSALTYEISRQRNMVKNGLEITRETRHYDEDREITTGLRKKESVDDYRYIPDPDVQPIEVTAEQIERVKKALPELPAQKMARFEKQYGTSADEAYAICLDRQMAADFEAFAKTVDAKIAARFLRGTLKKQLNWRSWDYSQFSQKSLTAPLCEIIVLLQSSKVTEKIAEKLLIELMEGKIIGGVGKYAEKNGLLGIQSGAEIDAIVDRTIAENEKAAQDYAAGNEKALHFLAGKVMAATKGKAAPDAVQELLRKRLAGK